METQRQPTYKRQRYLLSFISQLPDSGIRKTYLQKLIFLNMMETSEQYYGFVPYKYGPYSFQLAADLSVLLKQGFILQNEDGLYVDQPQQIHISSPIALERGDALLRKVYRLYPYYTLNSEILDRLFSPDEQRLFYIERNKLNSNEEVLFTIGYEGYNIESFINILLKNNVHLLCDVRKNPISRKFGFSKNNLQHFIEGTGIQYYHIPELGIESEKRISLSTIDDYNELFREYTETLPAKRWYLDKIHKLLKANRRVALMCFEKDAKMCHRHVIRDDLIEHFPIRSIDL